LGRPTIKKEAENFITRGIKSESNKEENEFDNQFDNQMNNKEEENNNTNKQPEEDTETPAFIRRSLNKENNAQIS